MYVVYLDYFVLLVSLYTLWKNQRTAVLLMFEERDQWPVYYWKHSKILPYATIPKFLNQKARAHYIKYYAQKFILSFLGLYFQNELC